MGTEGRLGLHPPDEGARGVGWVDEDAVCSALCLKGWRQRLRGDANSAADCILVSPNAPNPLATEHGTPAATLL